MALAGRWRRIRFQPWAQATAAPATQKPQGGRAGGAGRVPDGRAGAGDRAGGARLS